MPINTRTQTQQIKPKNTNSKLNPLNQLPFPLKIKSIMQYNWEDNKDQCWKTHAENPSVFLVLPTKPSLFQTINNKINQPGHLDSLNQTNTQTQKNTAKLSSLNQTRLIDFFFVFLVSFFGFGYLIFWVWVFVWVSYTRLQI